MDSSKSEAWEDATAMAEEADQALNNALSEVDDVLRELEECTEVIKDECQDDATASRVGRIAETLRQAMQLLNAVYTDLDQLPGMLQDKADEAADAEENDEQEAV